MITFMTGNLYWSPTYKTYLDTAITFDYHFHLHYIPAPVSTEPNKMVDNLATQYARTFSPAEQQYSANIELSALKTSLKNWQKK